MIQNQKHGKFSEFHLIQENDNFLLSGMSLESLINKFWSEIFFNYSDFTLQVQIRITIDSRKGYNLTRSLSNFSFINIEDKDSFIKYINSWYNVKNSHYNSILIKDTYILYRIVPKTITQISLYEEPQYSPIKSSGLALVTNNSRLPATMDLWNWSKDITFNNSYTFASYVDHEKNLRFKFNIYKNYYKCVITSTLKDDLIWMFTDTLSNSSSLGSFTRVFHDKNKNKQIFIEGELVGEESRTDNLFIRKNTKKDLLSNRILASDIETWGASATPMSLASISIFSKETSKSWYILDYTNAEAMIHNYLSYLLKEFNNYIIYFHNFSSFDSIFLLKYISNFNDKAVINIVKRDDKILEVSIKLNNNKITFRDSLLILPASLDKLGKTFNVGKKIEFDFNKFNNSSLSDTSVKVKLLEYNLSDCKLL